MAHQGGLLEKHGVGIAAELGVDEVLVVVAVRARVEVEGMSPLAMYVSCALAMFVCAPCAGVHRHAPCLRKPQPERGRNRE